MSEKIRLKNRMRRLFVCDLEQSQGDSKQTFRTTHDPKTGVEGYKFHDYKTYPQLTLKFNEISEPLDREILKNASIQGAIRAKRLQVLRT